MGKVFISMYFLMWFEKLEKEDGVLYVIRSFKNKRTFLDKRNNKKVLITFSALSFLNNSSEKKNVLEGEKVCEYVFPISLHF